MFVSRKLTKEDVEAARLRALKYFGEAPAPKPPAPLGLASDEVQTLARYLFADAMGSIRGGVERSQAIGALATLAGVDERDLVDRFQIDQRTLTADTVFQITISRGKRELARSSGWDHHQVLREAHAMATRHARTGRICLSSRGFSEEDFLAFASEFTTHKPTRIKSVT